MRLRMWRHPDKRMPIFVESQNSANLAAQFSVTISSNCQMPVRANGQTSEKMTLGSNHHVLIWRLALSFNEHYSFLEKAYFPHISRHNGKISEFSIQNSEYSLYTKIICLFQKISFWLEPFKLTMWYIDCQ